MTEGYIYCFSNPSMPGIIKIGMTERDPRIRLSEANISTTWGPPTPYKIEFAKKVYDPKQKEVTLHKILSIYRERIHHKHEFFRVSPEEVLVLFDLIDGKMWNNSINDDHYDDEDDFDKEEANIGISKICRDIKKCFADGQRIRHSIGTDKIWIGIYDSSKNGIIYNENIYIGNSPLNQFVMAHYKIENPNRKSANAWSECEYEKDGIWISTYDMPLL